MDYRFALIDSGQQMRFHRRLDRAGAMYLSLFAGYPEESLLDMAPLLIDLNRDDELGKNLLTAAERLGKLKPCVNLLFASLPMDELAAHLRQFHLAELSNGREMIVRWYDGRILPAWLEILGADQRALFTQHVSAWTYLDRFGEPQQLPLPAAGATEPPPAPIRLDDNQLSALMSACEADMMIADLREVNRDELRSVPYRTLYPFVQEHLLVARQHGLTARPDRLQLLTLALHTSGRYVDHPQVAQRLSMPAHAHEETFENWIAGLGQDVFDTASPLWDTIDDNQEASHAP